MDADADSDTDAVTVTQHKNGSLDGILYHHELTPVKGSVAKALQRMIAAGFSVQLVAGRLRVSPADRLTDAQRAYIRAHKVLLLEELRAELAPEPLPPLVPAFDQDAFEERAAILEYDAGFSRDEAERRALTLMRAENLTKPNIQAPPVESAVAPPLPVSKPEQVCCGDCAHSVLPPDTDPVYGWRLCGLGLSGGGFGRAAQQCGKWAAMTYTAAGAKDSTIEES